MPLFNLAVKRVLPRIAAARPASPKRTSFHQCSSYDIINTPKVRYFHQAHITKVKAASVNYTQIPDTTDPEAILPILNTIPEETAEAYNKLLQQLAESGRSLQAQKLYNVKFRHDTLKANVNTYSQLMMAYINDAKYEEAMDIYYQIRDTTNVALSLENYQQFIHSLTHNQRHSSQLHSYPQQQKDVDVIDYTVEDVSIFDDLNHDSDPALLTAFALFQDMRQMGHLPSTAQMYIDLLKACTKYKDAYILERLHKLLRMDQYLDPTIDIYHHLMEAYRATEDGSTVIEIWETTDSRLWNQETVSILLNACLENGYYIRSDAVWNRFETERPDIRIAVEDFNCYLQCLIKREEINKAKQVLEKRLKNGEADQSSVAIMENVGSEKGPRQPID